MCNFEFRIDSSVVHVHFKSPPQSTSDIDAWEKLAAQFLKYAIARRTVWIASDDVRAMELAWCNSESVDEPQGNVAVSGGTYSLWYLGHPSEDVLLATLASGDFTWDALYFIPLPEDAIAEVRRRVLAYNATREDFGHPGELIDSYGDGRGLQWIDYPGSPEQITRDVSALLTELRS